MKIIVTADTLRKVQPQRDAFEKLASYWRCDCGYVHSTEEDCPPIDEVVTWRQQ